MHKYLIVHRGLVSVVQVLKKLCENFKDIQHYHDLVLLLSLLLVLTFIIARW